MGKRKRRKGIVFVVSAPSGCGKTTLCRRLLRAHPDLTDSISATTRKQRKGERKNIDYIYMKEGEFKRGLKAGEFLEHALVFGNYYGTPKRPVAEALKKGKDVLLSIDVQGAAQIKKMVKDAVLIFILPPLFDDLKKRLLKRSSESMAQIRKRLRVARRELKAASIYDYAVVNDDMKKATDKLSAIVKAERCRLR